MPVIKAKGGWKWGKNGEVRKTRSAAVKDGEKKSSDEYEVLKDRVDNKLGNKPSGDLKKVVRNTLRKKISYE